MTPPVALLDVSYLGALVDADHPRHEEVAVSYRELVDRYEAEQLRLVALAHHIGAALPGEDPGGSDPLSALRDPLRRRRARRRGTVSVRDRLLAPVDTVRPGRQHRRAARGVAAREGMELDLALTLVYVRRERIALIGTLATGLAVAGLETAPAQSSN